MTEEFYNFVTMITLITGGQRSGKSAFAERLALKHSPTPIYIATSRIFDEDFRKRVEAHKMRRGNEWTNIEQPLHIADIQIPSGATVLLDCLTLLATNWLFECRENPESARSEIFANLDRLLANDADFFIVTNEIGMGGTSENRLQRIFTDLQGDVNRHVAALADRVYLLVSGIEVLIKG